MVSRKRHVVGVAELFQEPDLPHSVSNGESTVEEDQNYFESNLHHKDHRVSSDSFRPNHSVSTYEQTSPVHHSMAPPQQKNNRGPIISSVLYRSTSHNSNAHFETSMISSESRFNQSFRPIQRQPQTNFQVDAGWSVPTPSTEPQGLAIASSHAFTDQYTSIDTADAVAALLDLTPSVYGGDRPHEPFPQVAHNPQIATTAPDGARPAVAPAEGPSVAQRDFGAYMAITSIDLASRSRQLLFDVPVTDKACKCKNTHCLKLYCTCFQTGTFCDLSLCTCKDCKNIEGFNGPNSARPHAIAEILKRRIDAFEPRLKKKTGEGCACKRSRCVMKYCDCFAIGVLCTSTCTCDKCENHNRSTRTSKPGPTKFKLKDKR